MRFLPFFTAETKNLGAELKSLQDNSIQEKRNIFIQVILNLLYKNEELSHVQQLLYENQNLRDNYIDILFSKLEIEVKNTVIYLDNKSLHHENDWLHQQNNALCGMIDEKNTILDNDNKSLHHENDSLQQQNNALFTILSIMIVVFAFFLVYFDSLSLESAQSLPCI